MAGLTAEQAELTAAWWAMLAPPPDLTVSQWADARRRLSPEASAEPGRWNTSRAEYQRGIMDAMAEPAVETVVVQSSAQVGKPLAISTPIATPAGWTTMGEIEPGDVVFGADGAPIRVTGVSPVKYGAPCYRMTFSDGAKITSDAEHLWYVESDTPLVSGRPWSGAGAKCGTLTTEEIAATFQYGKGRNRYAIPLAQPLNLPPAALPIDPYVLGAWLGDGHSASSRIFCHEDDAPHFADQIERAGYRADAALDGTCWSVRIDAKLRHICPRGHDKNKTGWAGSGCAECGRAFSANYGRRLRGSVEKPMPAIVPTMPRLLSDAGLLGNKHVPAKYLRASIDQRLALLCGLMDTDGTIGEKGRCEFVTTSLPLAEAFSELLSSLGLKFTRKEKRPTTTYRGQAVEGALAYRFSFLAYDSLPVFRLPRKIARMKASAGGRPSETRRRRIVGVERVESVPVRCIMVDAADHLFLAGKEMIPTHNTETILNVIGYFVDQDPAPVLVLQPTLEMGQAFSKDRLAPMLRDTPALHGKVKDARARDSGNTLLHKTFAGGHITIAGANSAASLASRPIRVLLADEVDRYPLSAGTEGDPVSLARKRTTTFWNRKVLLVSTPTVKGQSRIEAAFAESDQRYCMVPCPDCGEEQRLLWSQVRWPDGEPLRAEYCCAECGTLWTDARRWSAIRKARWVATAPFRGVAGFHLSELYSPWRSLGDTAADFVASKQNPERLRAWVNTALGETWEDRGETVDHGAIDQLREVYGPDDLPEDVIFATAGVDTQDDRLEVEIVGWGEGERSTGIAYHVIHGDPAQDAVWQELDSVLLETYRTHEGRIIRTMATAIDSGGHHAEAVLRFCRERFRRRVYAIKGMGGQGKPIWPLRASKSKTRDSVFMVGVDTAKDSVYARFKITEPGPGFCRIPADPASGYDDDWIEQVASEQRMTRYREGKPYTVWVLPKGKRNEALDCRVYATAAMKAAPKARAQPPAQQKPPARRSVHEGTDWVAPAQDEWVGAGNDWLGG